jgi:type II secretory pathway pseudopilin PulG
MSRFGRRFIADESGATLLELLMSLAVFGLLLPVIAGWLTAVTALWNQNADRLEAKQQAIFLLKRVGTEVREGSVFLPQRDGLAFLSDKGRLIRYRLSQNGYLLREEEGVGSVVIGSGIADCRFLTEAEGRLVTLHLTTHAGRAQFQISQTWAGRGSVP